MTIPNFTSELITKEKLNAMVDGINALSSRDMVTNETIYVGVGQTYTTLKSALNYCAEKIPKMDYRIEIIIKSGTTISEQLIYENVDFGHVIISSEDVEVNVDAGSFLIKKLGSLKPFFYMKNGTFPLINTTFKGNDSASNNYNSIGILCYNSNLIFSSGKGCYSFEFGIWSENSYVEAVSCNLKNVVKGLTARHCRLNLVSSSFENYTLNGLDITNSIADIYGVNLNTTSPNTTGCSAENSNIIGTEIKCNASTGFFIGGGGSYRIGGVKITGNSFMGISLYQGGMVNASGTTCTLSQTPNTITPNGIIFK